IAPLARSAPRWVPATEVRGEGIFVRFEEARLTGWGASPAVQERTQTLFSGHREWRAARRLEPVSDEFPGARAILIHTFAHLHMLELALECGYSASSVRERVYSSPEDGADMAGLLIYTAAADSEGTLGGLVRLGTPELLGQLVEKATRRAELCASDPLCS